VYAMIYTNDKGVPFAKPEPSEFATTVEYLRAYSAYKDAISDCANRAFDEGLRNGFRRGKGRRA
jgi:hypothetical protein